MHSLSSSSLDYVQYPYQQSSEDSFKTKRKGELLEPDQEETTILTASIMSAGNISKDPSNLGQ